MPSVAVWDTHRHIGVLPPFNFYAGDAVQPATHQIATVKELIKSLDEEGTERALVIPNYGVPDPDLAFSFNELCIEAANTDDRIRAGLWVSPRPQDKFRTEKALALAKEKGVVALKLSFLLGGSPTDPECRPLLDQIFTVAKSYNLVVHVHTSPGAASDIDEIGHLVEWYGDQVGIHLVHLGGGMSGHIKLIGGRFFDWIADGKKVYSDASWAIGFAPRWLVSEIERRGIGHDRILFATDEPWGDHEGELARMTAAAGDGELSRLIFNNNFRTLYK